MPQEHAPSSRMSLLLIQDCHNDAHRGGNAGETGSLWEALVTVKQVGEVDDTVLLILEGAGTDWIGPR